MMYVQETDSKIVYARRSNKVDYSFSEEPVDETLGGYWYVNDFPLPSGPNALRPAWESIQRVENRDIADEARRLLSAIQKSISILQGLELDLSYIPRLWPFLVDGGSVLFEWIFSNYRIGFNIEPNPQESGWYLITNRNLGEISAFGFISGMDINKLILWLLNFIVSNS
jgi:hypothetical protein